jgi:NitT/TauT family transport system substrate-binding protein
MRKKILAFFFLTLFLSGLPVWADESPVLKKTSFIPHWSPQAQFAGYYVAYEKGWYKKHGLDVTIIPGGPTRSPLDYLKHKEAEFGSLWLCSALHQRDKGLRLVNIAQIMQRSALMLVAKKASGIKSLEDLEGKKVGLWRNEFQIQPKALFKKYNLKVKVIPQSFSVNLFLRGGVDLASAMWYNEYHILINSGLNPDELFPIFYFDHGLNFPEDGLYCLEETFNKDPEKAAAFVRASLEGWTFAFAHPEETLNIVIKYMTMAKVPANRVHQQWMLARMKDLIVGIEDKNSLGKLKKADYQQVAQELKTAGQIKSSPEFSTFYRGLK